MRHPTARGVAFARATGAAGNLGAEASGLRRVLVVGPRWCLLHRLDLHGSFLDAGLHRDDRLDSGTCFGLTVDVTEAIGQSRNRPARVPRRHRSKGNDFHLRLLAENRWLRRLKGGAIDTRRRPRHDGGRRRPFPNASGTTHQPLDIGLDRR